MTAREGWSGGQRLALAGLALALPVLALLSLLVGAGYIGPGQSLAFLLGQPAARADAQIALVVLTLRLPRTLAALLVGAALGASGALLQAATRNPLAESGLLGINAGAALGVVLGITYAGVEGGGALPWAFGGATVGSAAVLLIAGSRRAALSPLRLVLAGVALGATFRGLTAALLTSNLTSYDQYRFWVMGSLSGVTLAMVWTVLPAFALGLALAALVARPLAALLLGDDAARALGQRPGLVRAAVALAVTLLSAAAVALAGPLVFLGLLAPQLARAVAGPRLDAQVSLSALAGAAVLLAAEIVARLIIRPFEAPVSVVLALLGAPLLVWAARSGRALGPAAPGAGR